MLGPVRWLLPLGTSLLRVLPLGVADRLAAGIAGLCYLALHRRRATILDNLAHVVPEASPRERRRLARRTFRNFALVWVDFLRLPLLDTQQLRDLVVWDTRHHADAAAALGKGAVVATLHLGGVELAGPFAAALGFPIHGIAEDLEPGLFDALRRYRESTGMKIWSLGEARTAYRVLHRHEALALVADRLIVGAGLEVDFCGGRRMLPVGPAACAVHTGAPLLVTYLVRASEGTTRYRLVTEAPRLPSGTVEELTRAIAADFSRIVRQYPDQWFVFQPNWLGPGLEAPIAAPAPAGAREYGRA